jgi:hypothetical protein
MGNTTLSGIWSPDEDDTLEPDVWSAMMADSIEQGLGVRVARQEKNVGAFLNITDPFTMTAGPIGHAQVPLPFTVTSEVSYVKDMELTGGVLKVPVSGQYFVSATACAQGGSGYLELTLFKNSTRHGQSIETPNGSPFGQTLGPQTAMMNCIAGDLIWASACQYGGDTGTPPTLNVNFNLLNTLSVALVQAFPEPV